MIPDPSSPLPSPPSFRLPSPPSSPPSLSSSPCSPVQAMRLLAVRGDELARMSRRLVRRYARGRTFARQVAMGLDALLARGERVLVSAALDDALAVTDEDPAGPGPPPAVLWRWACDHVRELSCAPLRRMLRIAARHPRCDERLAYRRLDLTATPEGLVALAHDAHLVSWGPAVAQPAIAEFLERWK